MIETNSGKRLFGNRIPKDFFVTEGEGHSDITVHAGSYHLALRDAGIGMCNMMNYSSILPKIAREIEHPEKAVHGSVMESIMAVSTCNKGERTTAAVIYGWLYDKNTREKFGGLVCEYNGPEAIDVAEKELWQSLNELYVNGYSDDYDLCDIKIISKSIEAKKRFGTVLVALCFTSYEFPEIE